MGKPPTIIRAYQLKKGDRFRKLGTEYIVIECTPSLIKYKHTCHNAKRDRYSFGSMSRERIELIIY